MLNLNTNYHDVGKGFTDLQISSTKLGDIVKQSSTFTIQLKNKTSDKKGVFYLRGC